MKRSFSITCSLNSWNCTLAKYAKLCNEIVKFSTGEEVNANAPFFIKQSKHNEAMLGLVQLDRQEFLEVGQYHVKSDDFSYVCVIFQSDAGTPFSGFHGS